MPRDLLLMIAQTSAYDHRQALMKRFCAHAEGAEVAQALLSHGDWRVREQAVLALHRLKVGKAVGVLSHHLCCDEAVNVRVRCAFALSQVASKGDRLALDALLRALTDADADVRYRACYAIGQVAPLEDERAFAGLIGLLEDGAWYVRHGALKALYALSPTRAHRHLIEAQSNEMRRVRQTAQVLLSCYTQLMDSD